jgi:alpha-D-ribose 1-methylphosphonate 5-triphosphate diphosphatase
LLDILSSDYYPASLLQAAFALAAQDNACDLAHAVRMVSLAPARAAGLNDRGEIAVGLRADLVQARSRDGLPVVQQVWREAKRVF